MLTTKVLLNEQLKTKNKKELSLFFTLSLTAMQFVIGRTLHPIVNAHKKIITSVTNISHWVDGWVHNVCKKYLILFGSV